MRLLTEEEVDAAAHDEEGKLPVKGASQAKVLSMRFKPAGDALTGEVKRPVADSSS